MNIISNQSFEIDSFICYRAKMTQQEIQFNLIKMSNAVIQSGARLVGRPITVTYEDDGEVMDVEIILPVNPLDKCSTEYKYVNKMQIGNAVMTEYKGNPVGLQIACERLAEYLKKNNLIATTGLYKIPVLNLANPYDIENIEINMYIGVSKAA